MITKVIRPLTKQYEVFFSDPGVMGIASISKP
jgi:hypothetical protein